MAPNTTRRAFRPHRVTRTAWPRRDQPDRNGGNSSRSVSFSASTALRGGNRLMRLRMRIFFPPHLRVGGQGVARPLQDIVQPVQPTADGVVRGQKARPQPELLL